MNTPQRPTVLILGANGRLGLAAAQAFDAAGWQVLAQVRRRAAASMPAGVRLVQTPLSEPEALAVQAAGAQVVVYALNPVYTRWAQEAIPMAVGGMDLAQRLGARFMLPGNVYNFGTQMPALLREDTAQRADTRKGRIRVAIEAEMARRCAAGTLRATVLRAGDFFGGGAGSWFDLVITKSLVKGKLAYPGPLDVPHAWAYLPDLARAFVAVAANAPQGFTRLHFAGHTFTGRELLSHIESAAAGLGLRPATGWRHGAMPWGLIRAIGTVYPLWRELARMSYLWRVPHALDGAALQAITGALPGTAPPAALRQTLIDLGHGVHAAAASAAAA